MFDYFVFKNESAQAAADEMNKLSRLKFNCKWNELNKDSECIWERERSIITTSWLLQVTHRIKIIIHHLREEKVSLNVILEFE